MKNFTIILLAAAAITGLHASAATLSLTGDGTSTSPYQIATAYDWNTLANYMTESGDTLTGKYVKLTADIDFSGIEVVTIGLFGGDLDGASYTIKGVTDTLATTYTGSLITTATATATIHDFTLAGEILATANYCGGVVGTLSGTISNVTNTATYTSSGGQYNGSIVGFISGGSLTGCVNRGSVTSSALYAGGLIGYGINSTVKNCSNEDTITTTANYVGGIAGRILNSSISGCQNNGTVYAGESYGGGLFGYTGSDTITDCYNNGSVIASGIYVGGLVGYGYTLCYYENCGNLGSVHYSGSIAACYVGGVFGRAYYGTYINCFNTGTVTVADPETAQYVAGVFAYLYSASTYTITGCYNTADINARNYFAGLAAQVATSTVINMTDCYNTGNITASGTSTSGSYPVAGLMLYVTKGSTFTNCWNSGNVTSNGNNYTGGVFGTRKASVSTATNAITISNCYNTGKITATGSYAGGLMGAHYTKYSVVDSCYNTGDVTGAYYVGGIAGMMQGGAETYINNSWNSGNVTAETGYAGGIVGYSYTAGDYVDNCFNVGNVTSLSSEAGTNTSYGYAIGGVAGFTRATISNVYNTGTVTGAQCVGGIAGKPVLDVTTIANAYSTGKIVASTDSTVCGNIIGVSTSDDTSWGSSNSMSGTYFLSANAVECTDSISVGLTYAELAAKDLGTAWTAGDNYTYPRLSAVDNDYAKAHAVAVVPADGDSYSAITQNFSVGAIDGVTWTASTSSVEINGNNANFTENYTGTLTMTATCGEATATTELTCAVTTVGISSATSGETRTVVAEKLYTTSGAQAAQPTDGKKAIYIVVRTYDDGSTATTKEIR